LHSKRKSISAVTKRKEEEKILGSKETEIVQHEHEHKKKNPDPMIKSERQR